MRKRLEVMIQRGIEEPDYGLWPLELRTAAGTVVGSSASWPWSIRTT
jgi:hypothetical protein